MTDVFDIDTGYFALTPASYRQLLASLEEAGEQVATLQGRIDELQDAAQLLAAEFAAEREHWRRNPHAFVKEAYRAEQARWPGATSQFRAAIRLAIKRGHPWSLTPKQYEFLTAQPCADCGGDVGAGIGLDRLDHRRGYEFENVRPCCGPCNVRRGRSPLPRWT